MLLDFLKKITNGDGSSSWKLTYDRFKPAQESLRETLCTLGNGYFATRGAAIESCASRVHYPGTYMAGVYNKLATHISGRTIHNDDLVNCPNWMLLTFRVGKGEWVTPSTSKLISFYQELDIRKGILFRRMRVQDKLDQVTLIESKVMVHMADPHRGVIKYVITPENYDGWIVVRSALDGTVENKGVARYGQLNSKHFKANSLGSFSKNGIFCSVETSQSKIEIALASKIHIFSSGKEIKYANRVLTQDKKGICEEFGVYLRRNRKYEIEKTVCIYTSRDKDVRSPLKSAIKCVRSAHRFDMLLKTHKQAWDVLWKKFDIQIEGDDFAQKVVRLHIFHLLQTASIHNFDIDAGLPARGLTGEAYRGHIFWDEMYVMPFFDLHSPDISKSLLMYRHRRLHQARKYAKKSGYKGSMFPWQSSATGDEETQIIHLNPMSGKWGPDNSRIQRHVSFAIAYNVWQLWKRTGDVNFISKYGAEMMLSIAQFGASLSKYNARDGRYHSEGVMGPDEFHEKLPGRTKAGFRDNAYTNILIVWTLLRAKEILESVSKQSKRRLLKKLNITEKELSRWDDISHKMKIIFNEEGVISQFDGYFDLQELNWNAYRLRYGNIQRMDRILKTEGKSPNDYKVSKQADV